MKKDLLHFFTNYFLIKKKMKVASQLKDCVQMADYYINIEQICVFIPSTLFMLMTSNHLGSFSPVPVS